MIRAMVARRIAIGIGILIAVSMIVFIAVHLLPGDAARTILGREATPYTLRLLRAQLGLSKPVPVQYWDWLRGLVTGNWGTSLVSSLHVSYIVGTHAENTAVITVLTMLIATPISILLGSYTALRSGKASDNVASVITLCLTAVPEFVVGIMLIFLFAASVFHILPAASLVSPTSSIFSQLKVTILPVATLVLGSIPYPTRMIRASMIDVLQSEYVMMARLKGLPERQVVLRHALRNALAPMIQASALTLLFLSGGVVVVETVFSYPGLGYALIQAVDQRDIPVIQTLVVLIAAACVVINLLADLAGIMVTPRLRARLSTARSVEV
jgi:peptide/nickel transport system permease protein